MTPCFRKLDRYLGLSHPSHSTQDCNGPGVILAALRREDLFELGQVVRTANEIGGR
jgi:hypothetical protein